MLISFYTFNLVLFLCVVISIYNVISKRFLMDKIFNLIAVFATLALMMMLWGIGFLSFVVLIVFVGAIAVLFLFVVMIVNPDFIAISDEKRFLYKAWSNYLNLLSNKMVVSNTDSENISELKNKLTLLEGSTNEPVMNVMFSMYSFIYFCLGFVALIFSKKLYIALNTFGVLYSNYNVSLFHYGFYPMNEMAALANLMYQDYGVSLFLIGLLLLVAMIGVIILTLKRSNNLKRQNITLQFFRYRR